jgi:hypothetical protein
MHIQFSIRSLMCLTVAVAVCVFLWMHTAPVALLLLTLVPTLICVIERHKVRNRLHSPYVWALILVSASCVYLGSIGPFNMLLGCYLYDNPTLMRVNELGRWIYLPMRSFPETIRYQLDVNYVSGWRNYGVHFADPDDREMRAPSFPTQLY